MARKAQDAAELVSDVALDEQALAMTQNAAAAVQGMSDERDLVNQLLGQVQMARSFARFADVVSLSKLAHIKETKMYRALQGKTGIDADGNPIADVGTWDGFCQALGLSRSKVDEDLTNLNAFGEEALKQLSAVGAGYRDLRQYRRLPEDQKSALIEVAALGDKESFVELAEEIITKHHAEKTELKKRLDDAEASYTAQSKLLANTRTDLDNTKRELEKVSRRVQSMSADQAAKELRVEVTAIAFEAEADITGKLREAFNTLQSHSESTGTDHSAFQAQLIGHLENLLRQMREEFQLPEQAAGAGEFKWMDQLNQQGEG